MIQYRRLRLGRSVAALRCTDCIPMAPGCDRSDATMQRGKANAMRKLGYAPLVDEKVDVP